MASGANIDGGRLAVIIAAVDKATGPLREINKRISEITAPVRKLKTSFTQLGEEAGLPLIADRLRGVGSALGGVLHGIDTAKTRMLGLGAAGVGLAYTFKKLFINPADQFERLNLSLEAIEGNAKTAKKDMDFLQSMTLGTPFQLMNLANAFRSMKAQGLDPMNGSLQAIADQISKVGGKGEDLEQVAMYLGRTWSTEKFQGEAVRSLTERGIPAWGLLQRAIARTHPEIKISVAQLQKLSEKGQLGRKAIALLFEQMALESKGASTKMMNSWSGMMSNLGDQWFMFANKVMQSGALDALKGKLNSFLGWLDEKVKSGDLDKWAKRISDDILKVIDWASQQGPGIVKALEEVGRAIAWLSEKAGGFGNLLKFSLGAYVGGPLILSLVKLGSTLFSLGSSILPTVIAALSGLAPAILPFLAVAAPWLMVAGAIGVAALLIVKNWRPIKTFFEGLWHGVVAAFEWAWSKIRPIMDAVSRVFGSSATIEGPMAQAWGVGGEAGRPTLNTGRAATAGLGVSKSEAHVTVDFNNAPRGTRVAMDPRSTAEIDLSTGFSMSEAQ